MQESLRTAIGLILWDQGSLSIKDYVYRLWTRFKTQWIPRHDFSWLLTLDVAGLQTDTLYPTTTLNQCPEAILSYEDISRPSV